VNDHAGKAHRKYVARGAAPDFSEVHGRPAGLRTPGRAVEVQDGAALADDKDIGRGATPHAKEALGHRSGTGLQRVPS